MWLRRQLGNVVAVVVAVVVVVVVVDDAQPACAGEEEYWLTVPTATVGAMASPERAFSADRGAKKEERENTGEQGWASSAVFGVLPQLALQLILTFPPDSSCSSSLPPNRLISH
jgi:hypothetical protein